MGPGWTVASLNMLVVPSDESSSHSVWASSQAAVNAGLSYAETRQFRLPWWVPIVVAWPPFVAHGRIETGLCCMQQEGPTKSSGRDLLAVSRVELVVL